MAKITVEMIQNLREKTGIGMMDCKKALEEAGGDPEKAIQLLRKRGEKVALKRSGQATKNGLVHAYIHPGANLGVLVEISCESDFSANTDALKNFAHDVCMQIAACHPVAVSPEDVDIARIESEKEIYRSQLKESGKPEMVIEKIVEGKLNKFYETVCLMEQKFIKNDSITIRDHLNELVAKVNENIKVKRFVRFEIGS